MEKLAADTNFDRISSYYLGKSTKDSLPDDLQKELERWESAYRLLYEHGSSYKVVPFLIKLYDIKQATAYRDIRNAKKLFNLNSSWDTKHNRELLWHMNMEGANAALREGKLVAHARYLKNLEKLNSENNDDTDFKNYQFNTIVIHADPSAIGLERVDNISELMKQYTDRKKPKTIELPLSDE